MVTLYLVFALCGFLETWALLMLWGYSAGPINAVPYITLVGGLILILVSAPLAVFMPRFSVASALLACALMFVWPASIFVSESGLSGLMVAAPPLVAAGFATWHLRSTRHSTGQGIAPARWLRIVLAVVPAILFCLVFNAPLVLGILLAGPPGSGGGE